MHLIEINYQPERSEIYLGSPSIVKLDDGALIATHDFFADVSQKVKNDRPPAITQVFRSDDDGQTWSFVRPIIGAFWSTLFLHNGELYLLGNDRKHGSIVIRRSTDGGYTWTYPEDEKQGLLFKGGAHETPPNLHGAPVPVCVHNGRIYRGFEDNPTDKWPTGFEALVISAPVDADLLDAASWTMSNRLPFDRAWIPGDWGTGHGPGWLEGNIVAGPDGELWNVIRTHIEPASDKACMIRVEDDGRSISYQPDTGMIDMPGGSHKFTIRRDEQTGWYCSLVNDNADKSHFSQRNVLSLAVSKNLRDWEVVHTLMRDDSGLKREDSLRLTGFQYADWQFDGDDLISAVRVSHRGAPNFHDSNRITFHRVADFRQYLPASR